MLLSKSGGLLMNEVFNTSKAHGLIVCDVNLVVDRAMLNVITMIDILIKFFLIKSQKSFTLKS